MIKNKFKHENLRNFDFTGRMRTTGQLTPVMNEQLSPKTWPIVWSRQTSVLVWHRFFDFPWRQLFPKRVRRSSLTFIRNLVILENIQSRDPYFWMMCSDHCELHEFHWGANFFISFIFSKCLIMATETFMKLYRFYEIPFQGFSGNAYFGAERIFFIYINICLI